MFQIDMHSKRTRLAIRFFTYGVMTVATIVISAILILFTLGFRFDNQQLTFEQGGLIQFRTNPLDASIILDGKQLSSRTAHKLTVPVGWHEVKYRLDGYREWSKTVNIEAGQLLWLNYARLIPERLESTTVRQFDSLHAAIASPNRQYMVLQPDSAAPGLVIAEIRNDDQPELTDITIPDTAFTKRDGIPSKFQLVEWNLGSRYLLVRHLAGDVNELIRVDRERPAEAINISAKYGLIGEAHFAGNNANQLIGLLGNQLRRFDIPGDSSDLLSEGIVAFSLYKGNLIGFLAERNKTRIVGVLEDGRETAVRTYPAKKNVLIDVSQYFNRNYLAIADGKTIELIRDPQDPVSNKKTVKKFQLEAGNAQWLYFSNSGRMIVAQTQGSFVNYDQELDKTDSHSFSVQSKVLRPFEWLDDYYLWNDIDNELKIIEFDGKNERGLGSVATGYWVTLSESGDFLYKVGLNAGGKLEFQRTQLVLEN